MWASSLRRDLREMKDAIDRYKDAADKNQIRVEVGSEGYPPDLETQVLTQMAGEILVDPEHERHERDGGGGGQVVSLVIAMHDFFAQDLGVPVDARPVRDAGAGNIARSGRWRCGAG